MPTLVLFAAFPLQDEPDRLTATLGVEVAARLRQAMLEDTCTLTQGVGAKRILVTSEPTRWERLAKSQRLQLMAIEPGAAVESVLTPLFAAGPVLALGDDTPTLPRAHLHQALDLLMEHERVRGASPDGGLYLIGACAASALFDLWSSPVVELPPWRRIVSAAALAWLKLSLESLPTTVAAATRRTLAALAEPC